MKEPKAREPKAKGRSLKLRDRDRKMLARSSWEEVENKEAVFHPVSSSLFGLQPRTADLKGLSKTDAQMPRLQVQRVCSTGMFNVSNTCLVNRGG